MIGRNSAGESYYGGSVHNFLDDVGEVDDNFSQQKSKIREINYKRSKNIDLINTQENSLPKTLNKGDSSIKTQDYDADD